MVKLTQVEDESATSINEGVPKATTPGAAAGQENDEDYEDTSASESEDDSDAEDDDFNGETVYDRIVALREIIPPSQRSFFSSASATLYNVATGGAFKIGSLLWILSSSALLLGVPLSLSILSEQQLVEMEKEMKLQQDSAQVLAPGSENAFDSKAAEGAKA